MLVCARLSACVNLNFSVDSSEVGLICTNCSLVLACSVGVSGTESLLVIPLVLFEFATLSQR